MSHPRPGSRSLSITAKIWLIVASFSLPITVLVALMVESINADIAFSSRELAGNSYQRSLEQLQHALQVSWLELQACRDVTCTVNPQSAEQVSVALRALKQSQEQYGETLQFTPAGLALRKRQDANPEGLAARWEEAQDDPAKQARMLQHVRTMITHSGDTSNLILDPDLDSYYLMDVTLLALPQFQSRIADAIAQGMPMLAGESLSIEQRVNLAILHAELHRGDVARVINSTTTAVNEDGNFHDLNPARRQKLETGAENFRSAVEPFLSLLARQSASEAPLTSPEQFRAEGLAALEASYDYWQLASSELDALIEARMRAQRSLRTRSLLWASLALLTAVFLSISFMRSITRPLEGLLRSLGPGATLLASSIERIADNSRSPHPSQEEATIICDELNAHSHKMRSAVLELARHVRGADLESRTNADRRELVS